MEKGYGLAVVFRLNKRRHFSIMNEKEVERIMGYLNSKDPYYSFKETVMSKVFVDKSMLLKEVLERINTNSKYICITRPRRFGKTINAM